MQFTNKHGLPERIIRQLPKLYSPKEKRISVVDLINPPRIRTLQLKEWDKIIVDYADFLDTVIGLSVHERQSRLATSDEESEVKFEDVIEGTTLVGRSDNYDLIEKIIRDTKTIPVDRLKFPDFFHELELQLNIYAYQRRKRSHEVKRLEAELWFRDWKRYESEKAKPKLAVMKQGRKNAVKLFDANQQKEAEDFAHKVGGYVQYREGEDYPEICVIPSYPVELWTPEKEMEYVTDQIEYHTLAPMDCPESEHWKNDLRCKQYCRVRTVCPYAKQKGYV